MTERMTISIFCNTQDHTGERPYWDDATQCLYWIDVFGRRFHRADATGKTVETTTLPALIGSMALVDPSHMVLAMHHGFFQYDMSRRRAELICFPDETVAGNMRLNDGKVDAAGRFVCGGADYFRASPIAGIYSLDANSRVRKIGSNVALFNGICWSPDGKSMYYSDSALRRTYRCDYDLDSGEAGAPEVFVTHEESEGLPDGAAVDVEGYLWIAMVYGGQLLRVSPEGEIVRRIDFPVRGLTSVAFGGPTYDTLFVTSKSIGKDGKSLDVEAGGGSVFRVDGLPCPGLSEPRFRDGVSEGSCSRPPR